MKPHADGRGGRLSGQPVLVQELPPEGADGLELLQENSDRNRYIQERVNEWAEMRLRAMKKFTEMVKAQKKQHRNLSQEQETLGQLQTEIKLIINRRTQIRDRMGPDSRLDLWTQRMFHPTEDQDNPSKLLFQVNHLRSTVDRLVQSASFNDALSREEVLMECGRSSIITSSEKKSEVSH